MLLTARRACAAVLAAASVHAVPAAGTAPEVIVIESEERDASGAPQRLAAHFARPAGTGPFPAVVLLHGCSGAYTRGALSPLLDEAIGDLLGDGFAVLVVDSFGRRGVRELCTVPFGERRVTIPMRRLDAFGALAHLAALPDIDARRIGLLGWSHGGSTVLSVLAENDARPLRFAAAVAMYPGCGPYARRGSAYAPRTPFAILIGEADDWTPAAPCRALAERLASLGHPVEYRGYVDAHHAFDTTLTVRTRHGLPNTPTGSATIGGHPAARAEAQRERRAFLARWLKER